MPAGRRHAGDVGNRGDQLVQRRHLSSGEDVGAIRRRGLLAAEPEAFDEIVDVGEMVIDLAAAKDRKAPDGRAE